MNKEWVHLNRTTNEYLIGRRAFISNALDGAAFEGKIKCPCRSCCNMFYRDPFEVDQHLYVEGMDPHYIDIPWVEHGEQVHHSDNISSQTTEALNERSPENFMAAMLHDVFSNHVHMDESNHVGESSSACDETTDAHQFDNILREADGELYPGSRKKRLDFVVKLYQSKLLYEMSDAAFGPRLQRLYMSRYTAESMIWHSEIRTDDGVLRYPADSPAWKHLDNTYPDFARECCNVRLRLASDGFNPFGKTSPGNAIDVFLQPLIDDLRHLWMTGLRTYDSHCQETFTMRAALLWTINEFPAYAMLSG
ncbi:hypothetical protein TB1_008112 [Malus domestica]